MTKNKFFLTGIIMLKLLILWIFSLSVILLAWVVNILATLHLYLNFAAQKGIVEQKNAMLADIIINIIEFIYASNTRFDNALALSILLSAFITLIIAAKYPFEIKDGKVDSYAEKRQHIKFTEGEESDVEANAKAEQGIYEGGAISRQEGLESEKIKN